MLASTLRCLFNRLRAVATVPVARREVLAAAAASRTDLPVASATLGAPGPADIPSFHNLSRERANCVTVGVQLPNGGRFVREAVIEPERTARAGLLDAARCHACRRWREVYRAEPLGEIADLALIFYQSP